MQRPAQAMASLSQVVADANNSAEVVAQAKAAMDAITLAKEDVEALLLSAKVPMKLKDVFATFSEPFPF